MVCLLAVLADVPPAAARWSARLNRLENALASRLGDWSRHRPADGISGLQLSIAALVLVFTAGLIALLRWLGRRKPAAGAAAPASVSLLRHLRRDAHPPILLAIGVLGGYASLSLACFRIPGHAGTILAGLEWTRTAGLIVALFWFLFRVLDVVEIELRRWTGRTTRRWDDVLAAVVMRGLRLVVPAAAALLIVPTLNLDPAGHALLQTAASLALMGFIGFAFCQLAVTAEKAVLLDYRVDIADNLATRKIQTQVRILRKIAVIVILLVTVACMLTVFDSVRSLGRSILASAGVAGIVIGIAAQRSLGTFLAGIQIAFTQPIRIDDVVIVEGEWGRIEEITLTYVVVAIWDLRRMVLPITYFIEKPFQNWTRASSALLGTVFLYLDYTAPVDALRAELDRVLEASPRWDKKVKGLQVTDTKDKTIELRILASAADSSLQWDLRCEIREKLISFLQREHPECLPRTRLAWDRPRDAAPSPPGT
ncbi:MAG TPA: mechanosensitive ion channel domain-containing protein [Opitutaceae bacterium]|jgi:small-conductance mechanosensitive channel|nr:mechanosensitive ion channel domain-containing protein [Opitutaceae bacterium]